MSRLLSYQDHHPKVAELIEQVTQFRARLNELRAPQLPSAAQVRALVTALYDYTRFKGRQLLTLAQEVLSTRELDAIYEASPDMVKRADEDR